LLGNILWFAFFVIIVVVLLLYSHIFIGHAGAAVVNGTRNNPVIVAVGDMGCTPKSQLVIRNMESAKPDLFLGLGDYVFDNKTSCLFNIVMPFWNKIKIAFGPHDVKSIAVLQEYMKYFDIKRQYYSYNFQNIHFTVLSTEIPFKIGTPQYYFASDDLFAASNDPNIEWIFIYYHKPAYTSSTYNVGKAKSLRDTYHPVVRRLWGRSGFTSP